MNMFKRSGKRTLRRPLKRRSPQQPRPILKSPREIQLMREAGRIVGRVHQALKAAVRPGISTWELDQIALGVMQKYNSSSCFLGYRGFPANICVSVNDELVHGIPNKDRLLQDGDLVSIDVGVQYRGFIGDSAWTYAVGAVDEATEKLMQVTEESLYAGIKEAVVGNKIVDISRAVQAHVESHDLYVVRGYTGHGVGRQMHEPPQVLNYVSGDADGNYVIETGLVIAIEPMVQQDTWQTTVLKDDWTVVNSRGSGAAHYEHTVAVTNNGPEILTLP